MLVLVAQFFECTIGLLVNYFESLVNIQTPDEFIALFNATIEGLAACSDALAGAMNQV